MAWKKSPDKEKRPLIRDGFNEDVSGSTGALQKLVVSDARAGLCSEAPRSAPFV
jgi:hypothetical protein